MRRADKNKITNRRASCGEGKLLQAIISRRKNSCLFLRIFSNNLIKVQFLNAAIQRATNLSHNDFDRGKKKFTTQHNNTPRQKRAVICKLVNNFPPIKCRDEICVSPARWQTSLEKQRKSCRQSTAFPRELSGGKQIVQNGDELHSMDTCGH